MMKKKLLSAISLALFTSILLFSISSYAAVSYDRTGFPNTYTNTGDYAFDLLNVALTQVGYHENPSAADYTKYSNWFFGEDRSYAWCGIFVSWCAEQAGIPTDIIHKNKHVSGTCYENYAEQTKYGDYFGGSPYQFGEKDPAPGDLFFSTTDKGTEQSTHVGIIWKVEGNYIYTIEGNTHFKDASGEWVGYVANRMYNRRSGYQYYSSSNSTSSYVHILFYVHPDYENTSTNNNIIDDMIANPAIDEKEMVFEDVSADAYYHKPVQWALREKITEGTSPSTFSPDQVCTRGQAATFLYRFSSTEMKIDNDIFEDVVATAYYYYPVTWCLWAEITNGTTTTTFSPNGMVTRAQFITMLYRYAGCPGADTCTDFMDVPKNSYYAAAVRWAIQNGITCGTAESAFDPNKPCTRAQIITFLHRYAVRYGITEEQ